MVADNFRFGPIVDESVGRCMQMNINRWISFNLHREADKHVHLEFELFSGEKN